MCQGGDKIGAVLAANSEGESYGGAGWNKVDSTTFLILSLRALQTAHIPCVLKRRMRDLGQSVS